MALDLDKLEDSSHLLDILIQCEDVLDSMDLYCFLNWYGFGEVVEGPLIRRHWVSMSLLYPYNKMPDPRGALRLLKHGVMVEYNRMQRAATPDPAGPAPQTSPDHPPEAEAGTEQDWLIKLTFPRRLLDQIAAADLDAYEDDVQTDDVKAAKDDGLTDTSAYQNDEAAPEDGAPPPAGAPPADPVQQEGADGFPK